MIVIKFVLKIGVKIILEIILLPTWYVNTTKLHTLTALANPNGDPECLHTTQQRETVFVSLGVFYFRCISI